MLKNKLKKKSITKKLIFFVVILIVLVGGLVFALNTVSTGFRTNKSTYMQVNAWSNCYQVNNTGSANDYFIPTATSTEWSAFRTNKPSDVSLTACSSMPPRIAVWAGKVTKYTDSNGAWTQDCSTGYTEGQSNTTLCRVFFPETISTSFHSYEWIFNWTAGGCSGSSDSPKPTVRCILCTDYGDYSSCTGAGCKWHSYNTDCSVDDCWTYSSETPCSAAGCYWYSSQCFSGDICRDLAYQYECLNDPVYFGECEWDYDDLCCKNYGALTCS